MLFKACPHGVRSFWNVKYATVHDLTHVIALYQQSVFTVAVFTNNGITLYILQHYNDRIVLQNFSTLSVSCRAISVIINNFLIPMEILPSTPASCRIDMARCRSRSVNNSSCYTRVCYSIALSPKNVTYLQYSLHSFQWCESRYIDLGIECIGNIHVIQHFVFCRCANDQKATILIYKWWAEC